MPQKKKKLHSIPEIAHFIVALREKSRKELETQAFDTSIKFKLYGLQR